MPTTSGIVADAAARPIAAAIAVVIHDGQVLLVRRANPPDVGLWGFPGGKIDAGETIEAAAIRELYEETGVRGEARRVFTAVDAFDRNERGAIRRHFILIAILCRWLSGEPVAGDDALEARWFDLASLDKADLAMSFGVHDLAQQANRLILTEVRNNEI
jgi:mutator protein MutT